MTDILPPKPFSRQMYKDTDDLDANSLGRRSRAQHLIGEMRQQRGQLEAALSAFRSGAETTARLLAQAPGDPQRIFDHAFGRSGDATEEPELQQTIDPRAMTPEQRKAAIAEMLDKHPGLAALIPRTG